MEILGDKVTFLDVNLHVRGNKVVTSVHHKFEGVNNFINGTSCHPPHLISALPYNELLRISRLTSDEQQKELEIELTCQKFIKRGYSVESVEQAKNNLNFNNQIYKQVKYRAKSDKNVYNQQVDKMFFVTTYGTYTEKLVEIVMFYWTHLLQDPCLGELLPQKPMVSYRRGKSIKDMLVHAYFIFSAASLTKCISDYGFKACGHCSICNQTVNSFDCINGKKFNVNGNFSCNTEGIVYVLKCECNLFYIGESKRSLSQVLGTSEKY